MPLDDLDQILADTWATLDCAVKTRKHPFHSPVLASINQNRPDSRVVILREADPAQRILRFHTDIRAPKVQQIQSNPHVSFLFYSQPDRLQLRIQATATVHIDDEYKNQGWEESTLLARRCYSALHAPSTEVDEPTSGLPQELENRQPSEEEAEQGKPNFAVVRCTVQEIDWFSLQFTGHRRARFTWKDNQLQKTWLSP